MKKKVKVVRVENKNIEDITHETFSALSIYRMLKVIFNELKRTRQEANAFQADLRAKGILPPA